MKKESHLNPAWFNTSNGEELSEYIKKKVATFQKRNIKKKISAIIVPHAGYAYSLDTALESYALLNKNDYDRVVIFSPSHRFPFFERLGIEPMGRIETPLGGISFNEDLTNKFKELPFIIEEPSASNVEHSIHIQLPLIRHFLGDIPVSAFMFGQWKYNKHMENSAQAFYRVLDSYKNGLDKTLFIISSDFTHYGEMFKYLPFKTDIQENLNNLDHTIFHAFASQDIPVFEKVLSKTKATVCGAVALKFLLTLLPEKAHFEEIAYTTSGALGNDFTNSVSYFTAIISADWSKGFKVRLPEEAKKSYYTTEEQQMIVDITKKSLIYSVENDSRPHVNYDTIPPKLKENRAVFVTLKKEGNLRGCIGDILPVRPLVDSLVLRAQSAAFEDSRFSHVTVEELPLMTVEISVLSPPVPIRGYKEIILGKHGIILKKGANSAVFLPHVAIEQGWNLEQTLSFLAEKAELEKDAWKEDCEFYVFTAEIFIE